MTCANLQIHLLGDFRVASGTTVYAALNGPRLQSLLGYLLIHRDAPHHRQQLAFLFWPDSNEAQARTNLRKLLLALRRHMPDDTLVFAGQTVRWAAAACFTLDVADFERALAEADSAIDEPAVLAALERAVALYGGALLPGCYDDWIQPERERLAASHAGALERLCRILEGRRDYAAAARYAEALLAADPLREPAYRDLMRLLALTGNRAGALRVYHSCVTVLRNELDVEPDRETHALYEQLLRSSIALPRHTAGQHGTNPLVGRHDEWSQLQAAWLAAAGGLSRLVVLSGQAGIGKTRLTDELCDWVARQGGTVARARCGPTGAALAYAPVASWLQSDALRRSLQNLDDTWLAELARLLPDLPGARPGLRPPQPPAESWQKRIFFEALARGVLARSGPLLLALDDLQWCDPETLEWLGYLLDFAPTAPLCIAGTVRTEEAIGNRTLRDLCDAAARDGRLTVVELGPLTRAETTAMAGNAAGRTLPPNQTEELYVLTEGNPLFIVEAVRSLLEVPRTGQAAPPSALAGLISPTVQAVIERRLSLLSSQTRDLAGLASVFGQEFAFAQLQQAADADEERLLAGIDELWQRRIVRECSGRDGYEFAHNLIREAAYGGLGQARRQALHRRVAQALEASQGVQREAAAGQIAYHYEQAGRRTEAVPFYRRAAEAAEKLHAHREAIEHLRRGLVLLSPGDAAAAPMLERLGDVLHFTAQYREAGAAYGQALGLDVAVLERARLLRKTGNALRDLYEYGPAESAYSQAATALGVLPDGSAPSGERAVDWWQEWIQLQFEIVSLRYWQGQVDAAVETLLEMRDAIERHARADQRLQFHAQLLFMSLRRQRFAPSPVTEEYLRISQAALGDADLLEANPAFLFQFGFSELWHEKLAEAGVHMAEALRRAERTGDINLQARCLTYLAILHRRRGSAEEVRRYASRALEVAQELGMREYVATARANQAWLAWLGGDLAAVETHGAAALALWAQLPVGHASAVVQWTALWPLAGAALRSGNLTAAIQHARALLEPPQQRLRDELTTLLKRAIQAHERNEPAEARDCLSRAVAAAIASNLF